MNKRHDSIALVVELRPEEFGRMDMEPHKGNGWPFEPIPCRTILSTPQKRVTGTVSRSANRFSAYMK